MNIFVTGGLGYIGSHTVVQLIETGHQVVIIDNLSNSSSIVLERIEKITSIRPIFYEGDVRDGDLLRRIFSENRLDAVIHFAGLKSVSEGNLFPLKYYDHNVVGSLVLLREMANAAVKVIIFSSSATVYGEPLFLPYTELHPLRPINVYGTTKLATEKILQDLYASDDGWSMSILRYFNPVGAHISGLIGESPIGTPNNLMPYLAQVAVKKIKFLSIYGDDYNTEDGTGKRDYIHVDDLAAGHIAALDYLKNRKELIITNLGTGNSSSVMDLINSFERVSGIEIPYKVVGRRNGDLPEYYADPQHARNLLGWFARHDLDRMCRDTWRWQSQNPDGFIC